VTRIPSPRSKRRARIEIIPLIDIIFFLLATFVMVSLSMIQNRGIPVRLPAAATGAPQAHEDSLTLSIDEAGDVYLERERVDDGKLAAALAQLAAADPEASVFVNGDARAQLGRAIAVLDAVRRAGITRVAIETRAKGP
jgi:biopolymer transport protein ExbD